MDATKVRALLEDLEVNIDDLEATLEALLAKPLSQTANNLPLLDRAKLLTTTAYAIENLIFNALRVAGIDPATHGVKIELDRVKQYFAKIKVAEDPNTQKATLDKQAAGRFIKAALSGNDRYDREREETTRRNREAAEEKIAKMDKKRKSGTEEDSSKTTKRHKGGEKGETESHEPAAQAKNGSGGDAGKDAASDESSEPKGKHSPVRLATSMY